MRLTFKIPSPSLSTCVTEYGPKHVPAARVTHEWTAYEGDSVGPSRLTSRSSRSWGGSPRRVASTESSSSEEPRTEEEIHQSNWHKMNIKHVYTSDCYDSVNNEASRNYQLHYVVLSVLIGSSCKKYVVHKNDWHHN